MDKGGFSRIEARKERVALVRDEVEVTHLLEEAGALRRMWHDGASREGGGRRAWNQDSRRAAKCLLPWPGDLTLLRRLVKRNSNRIRVPGQEGLGQHTGIGPCRQAPAFRREAHVAASQRAWRPSHARTRVGRR